MLPRYLASRTRAQAAMGLVNRIPFLLSYLALSFLLSGVIINVLQILAFVLLWPLSKDAFRSVNNGLVNLLWNRLPRPFK